MMMLYVWPCRVGTKQQVDGLLVAAGIGRMYQRHSVHYRCQKPVLLSTNTIDLKVVSLH